MHGAEGGRWKRAERSAPRQRPTLLSRVKALLYHSSAYLLSSRGSRSLSFESSAWRWAQVGSKSTHERKKSILLGNGHVLCVRVHRLKSLLVSDKSLSQDRKRWNDRRTPPIHPEGVSVYAARRSRTPPACFGCGVAHQSQQKRDLRAPHSRGHE